jgi:8-oxo-dGTP diphosphatase
VPTSSAWSDASGRPLSDYPRPSVAVDTAVLTVPLEADVGPFSTAAFGRGLAVLLVRREEDDLWLLPGTFLHEGERLRDAVLRSLRDKAGVRGLSPRQLKVFDDPSRDERGWVLSVAHADTVPWERLSGAVGPRSRLVGRTVLRPVEDAVGLPFDHDAIVADAVDALRADYGEHPDPARLLPEPFTLRQLQLMHESVLGGAVKKDSFRRRMEPLLEPVGETTSGTVGKPARLFARRARSEMRDVPMSGGSRRRRPAQR